MYLFTLRFKERHGQRENVWAWTGGRTSSRKLWKETKRNGSVKGFTGLTEMNNLQTLNFPLCG